MHAGMQYMYICNAEIRYGSYRSRDIQEIRSIERDQVELCSIKCLKIKK